MGGPTLAALGLMALNDQLLKGSGLLPGLVTGKLSDFAFLFFAPIVLVFATRARSLLALLACYAAPNALYVGINVSQPVSDAFAAAMSHVYPMYLWCDVEDLVALAITPLSWLYLVRRPQPDSAPRRPLRAAHVLVTAASAIACMATSSAQPQAMRVTHEPVYMTWEEFRSTAVAVEGPQPIGRRGKIVIAHDHIFLSEPGRGVHVIDNRKPWRPEQRMFIRIPGNVDIAVRDNTLYADSFVDLLTFELDLEKNTAKLASRLENKFTYDPHQSLGTDEDVFIGGVDQGKGVVIGVKPLGGAAQ
jgi:hypothetical protein